LCELSAWNLLYATHSIQEAHDNMSQKWK
jgi:hypothetical protein